MREGLPGVNPNELKKVLEENKNKYIAAPEEIEGV